MAVSVNPIFLTVDEDLVTLNDPDEVASFSPTYNLDPSLTGAVSAITKASSTPYFTTPQFAVSPIGPDPTDLFNIGANTTDLKFVQNLGGAAYPTGGSGIDSGLQTSDGTSIYLFQSATTNNVIYGAIGDNAANPAAFVLVLDEQVTGGFVTDARLWILQYATIQHDGVNVTEGDFKDLTDKVFVGSTALSQSIFSDFSDVPAGSPIFAMIADDTNQNPVDYLVTAFQDGAKGTGIQLNVSNQGSFPGSLASGSQNIGYGTALRLDLVTNGDNTYTQSEGQSDTAIAFDTHQNVVQAGFTIVQNQGNRPTDLKIELWNSLSDTADGHNFFTSVLNEASVAIDKILVGLIDPDTGVVSPLFDSSNPADASHFVFSGNAITVLDLGLNYIVDIFQDSGFDRFTALNVTTTTFKGNVVPDTNAFVDIGRLTFASTNLVTEVDEVGSHIRIDDSGPDVTAQAAAADTLVVDDDALNTPVSAVFASLFTAAFGSDGPAASGATVYSLSTAGGPSGVYDTATDLQVQLKLDTGVVHGYVTIGGVDTDVFTVGVNSLTAEVTLTQQRAIRHVDTGTLTDASQDPTNLVGTDLIGLVATVTDLDGDTDSATADITQALEFNDAQPTITVPPSPGDTAGTALQVTNAAGEDATGAFGFDIGADKPGQYGSGVSDFVDANAGVAGVQLSLSGTVTGPPSSAITNTSVTLASEDADDAVFNFSFDYDKDPNTAGVQTGTATGTLSFDKAADTYTVAITSPVVGFSFNVLHTNELLAKEPTGNTGHPPIVVEKLAQDDPATLLTDEDFYVQFTADDTPLGFSTTGDVSGSADKAFTGADHDLAGGVETWVSATQSTNGVAGDTIQKNELLTLRFFSSDILGDVASGTEKTAPTATADGIVIKFDGIGANEDLILILDLKDVNGGPSITRAVVVENGDIFKHSDGVPAPYNAEFSLDNNDGLVIIENNDYNAAGEHYEIQGVQIMQGPNGLTGQGIDLNRAVGTNGGSSTTSGLQNFGGNVNDVLKIVDIGFVQSSSGTQDAHLDFAFQINDADGDLTTTQHLFVDFLTV
jgi:uncharacterized protein DUF5801